MSLSNLPQSLIKPPCPQDCYPPSNVVLGPYFHSGIVDPSPTLGSNDDIYINRELCTIWRKENGQWVNLGPICNEIIQGMAFVQETEPTEEDGPIVVGSLWVNTLNGYIYYYNGIEWVFLSNIMGFSRYLHTTTLDINTLSTVLTNPVIPSTPSLQFPLSNLLIEYQWAFNMNVSSPTISLPVDSYFLPVVGGTSNAFALGQLLSITGTMEYSVEISRLPRVLVTFNEVQSSGTVTHQVGRDVPIEMHLKGTINFTVERLADTPNEALTLDLATLTFINTENNPLQFTYNSGTNAVDITLNNWRMSTAGELLISEIIETTPDTQVEILSIDWGFPQGQLILSNALYEAAFDVEPLLVLGLPVFSPSLPADSFAFDLDLDWLPLNDTELDPPTIIGNSPTTWGYGTQVNVMLLNMKQSSNVRSGVPPKPSNNSIQNKSSLVQKSKLIQRANVKRSHTPAKKRGPSTLPLKSSKNVSTHKSNTVNIAQKKVPILKKIKA